MRPWEGRQKWAGAHLKSKLRRVKSMGINNLEISLQVMRDLPDFNDSGREVNVGWRRAEIEAES